MKAQFLYSQDGRGHMVRCGALMNELVFRGWLCAGNEGDLTTPDVSIVDYPNHGPTGPGKVIRIVDVPSGEPADLILQGWKLLRPEFHANRANAKVRYGVADVRRISGFSASEMAHRMASALVAITYGGMRASECACVGTPMVVIPRNDGERLNAHRLMKAGAAIIATDEEAPVIAASLLESPAALRVMSKAAQEVIDGLGCQRAADAIEELCHVPADVA